MKKYIRMGLRLKKLRGNVSQKAYAKNIGISYRAYQNYESGVRIPKPSILSKIAKKEGVTVEWILGGSLRSLEEKVVATKIEADLLHEGVSDTEMKLFRYFYKKGIVSSDDIDSFMNMTLGLKYKKFQEVIDSFVIAKNSPVYVMTKQIERILSEGNKEKIKAVRGFLKALDPWEKSQDSSAQPDKKAEDNNTKIGEGEGLI